MNVVSLPIPLAVVLLNLTPSAALEQATSLVLKRMKGRFPKLFRNLEALPPARVLLVPTDTPHQFLLEIGQAPVAFSVVQGEDFPSDARVAGRLEVMVDMLEGRADGDMLFFSRDIKVTGDTEVIVALRNTLDREEINIFEEITGLCGPFAQPVRTALTLADRVLGRVRARLSDAHDRMHRQNAAEKERVPTG